MSNKREFGEGPIFTITDYLCWFLLGDFYFLLLNIPLVIAVIGLDFNAPGTAAFLFLSFIPVGPAAAALLSVMGKLVRDKDTDFTKDFFKAYKTNFFQSLMLWLMEMLFFFIMYYDLRFFTENMHITGIRYLFYALALLVFITGIYAFPVMTRFYMKTKNILRLSLYFSIKNIKTTLLNSVILALAVLIFFRMPVVDLLIISLVCYGIMYFEKDLLKEIEDKLQPEPNK